MKLHTKHVYKLAVFVLIVASAISFLVYKKFHTGFSVPGTENWVTFKSKECGIEFKHPKEIEFATSSAGYCTIYANGFSGEDYYSFIVTEKDRAVELIGSMETNKVYNTNNQFAPSAVIFQNGTFSQTDGPGSGGAYFVTAEYAGKEKGYEFMTSRGEHDKAKLDLFEKILATVTLEE